MKSGAFGSNRVWRNRSEHKSATAIASTLIEMQTRAERLMENLTETKAKRDEVTQFPRDRKQLQDLIVSLDNVVREFAHNRVFFEASADDEKLAKKALNDLDQIIQITAKLIKGVEGLSK